MGSRWRRNLTKNVRFASQDWENKVNPCPAGNLLLCSAAVNKAVIPRREGQGNKSEEEIKGCEMSPQLRLSTSVLAAAILVAGTGLLEGQYLL